MNSITCTHSFNKDFRHNTILILRLHLVYIASEKNKTFDCVVLTTIQQPSPHHFVCVQQSKFNSLIIENAEKNSYVRADSVLGKILGFVIEK